MKQQTFTINCQNLGICPRKMTITVRGDKFVNATFEGGCDGNLKAISTLCSGQTLKYIVDKLKCVTCGNKDVSCSSVLAEQIENIIELNK
jgi:uncharacterized protein (TIGR03905 family)